MSGGDPAALVRLALEEPETFDAIWYSYLAPAQDDPQGEVDRLLRKSRGM